MSGALAVAEQEDPCRADRVGDRLHLGVEALAAERRLDIGFVGLQDRIGCTSARMVRQPPSLKIRPGLHREGVRVRVQQAGEQPAAQDQGGVLDRVELRRR